MAGFEHTKYIQNNCTHKKVNNNDLPLFIGKTVRNGKIDTNYDWYISKEISDKLERSKLNKKCLILPYVGSVGDLAIFNGTYEAQLGSNIAKIEFNDNNNYIEEYVYYYLKSPAGQRKLFRDIQGAVQKNITMEAIRNIDLPNVEILIQKKLANILGVIDSRIDLNNKLIKKLEDMIQYIYDYWFVQFDFPNEKGKPYKSSGGKMVYNEELQREIPTGWEVMNYRKVIKDITTGLNPRDNFTLGKGAIKYITVKNLTSSGYIDFSDCDCIDEEARTLVHNRSNIEVGDILFASISPLGRCALIFESPIDWDINESVFCIKPDNDLVSSIYLYMNLIDKAFVKKAEQNSTGSVFKGIRISTLYNMNLLLPNKNIIDNFTKSFKILFNRKYEYEKYNKRLLVFRDYLSPLLMNGQLIVK